MSYEHNLNKLTIVFIVIENVDKIVGNAILLNVINIDFVIFQV